MSSGGALICPSPEFAHVFAGVGEVTIHLGALGADPCSSPFVLLHGKPETWYEWRHVLQAIATHHPMIAPDRRGLGYSLGTAGGYDRRTVSEDILRLLSGHLGVERWHLVGHDRGRLIAFAPTIQRPDSVLSLTVVDVVILGHGGQSSQGWRHWYRALYRTSELPQAPVGAGGSAPISAVSVGLMPRARTP